MSRFGQLPIIPSLEISGNGGGVELEAFGGLLERRGIEEFFDGLPLSCGDLENQGVVQAVDQIDGAGEARVAGNKSGQDLEFEEIAALDVFDGLASGLKSFAAKAVYGRLNAAGNAAEADSDPERQGPQRPAEVQNDGWNGRQVAGNGLEFIAGGNGIRQLDELLAQVSFGDGSKLSSEQAADIRPGTGFHDVRDQHRIDCGRHKITLPKDTSLYENVQVLILVRKHTNLHICTNT